MNRTKWWEWLVAILVILTGMTLALLSIRSELDIIDERPHLASGYAMAWHGDARWNIEHPPLLKMISGVTARVAETAFPQERLETWDDFWKFQQWDVGGGWFEAEGENLLDLLWWARLPNILLFYGLACVVVWRWGRSMFGRKAGLFSLILMALSPTMLAHSRYVTTDMAATAGALVGAWALWAWLKAPSSRRAVVAGMAFGFALLCKYSLILLGPLSFVVIGVMWFVKWRRAAVNDKGDSRPIVWVIGQFLLMWAIAILVVFLVAWFAMRSMSADDIARTIEGELNALLGGDMFLFVADWVRSVPFLGPLGWFVVGLGSASGRALGGGGSVIFGQTLTEPVWWYFPGMWIFKSTVPVLIATLATVVSAVAYRPKHIWAFCKRTPAVPYVVLCVTVFMGAGVVSELNLGIRHVLAAFPFIFLVAGFALSVFWDASRHSKRRQYGVRIAIVGLFVWHAAAAFVAFPGYLSYANAFFGHDNAWQYTNDSNLDWGQEVYRMVEYANDRDDINEIHLVTYGVWQPAAYEVIGDVTISGVGGPENLPENGWLAISGSCYLPDYPTCLPEQAFGQGGEVKDPVLWNDVLSLDTLEYVSEGAMLLFKLDSGE